MKHNIANLERVAAAATDGPWYHDQNGDFVAKGSVENIEGLICDLRGFGAGFDLDRNGRHIATFNPDTAQALLQALREARAALQRLATTTQSYAEAGCIEAYNAHGDEPEDRYLGTVVEQAQQTLANIDANFNFTLRRDDV